MSIGLLLSACSTKEYKYTPPSTDVGRECVSKCQNEQRQCKSAKDKISQESRKQCLSESEKEYQDCLHDKNIEYIACLKFANSKTQKKSCKKPSCRRSACSTVNYNVCSSYYRVCFQSCGGVINILK